jgi:hypothetical protein
MWVLKAKGLERIFLVYFWMGRKNRRKPARLETKGPRHPRSKTNPKALPPATSRFKENCPGHLLPRTSWTARGRGTVSLSGWRYQRTRHSDQDPTLAGGGYGRTLSISLPTFLCRKHDLVRVLKNELAVSYDGRFGANISKMISIAPT